MLPGHFSAYMYVQFLACSNLFIVCININSYGNRSIQSISFVGTSFSAHRVYSHIPHLTLKPNQTAIAILHSMHVHCKIRPIPVHIGSTHIMQVLSRSLDKYCTSKAKKTINCSLTCILNKYTSQ